MSRIPSLPSLFPAVLRRSATVSVLLGIRQILGSFEIVDHVARIVLEEGRSDGDFVGLDDLPETLVEFGNAFVAFLLQTAS